MPPGTLVSTPVLTLHDSSMTQPECPFAVASKRSSIPKTLQEYMKKYLILRPPLDPRYFVQDHGNQLHLTESPPQNIVLSRYVESSKLLSSLYQAAPSPRRTFLREDGVTSQHSDNDSPLQQSLHPDIPQQPPNVEQSSPFAIKEVAPSHSESDFEECNHCDDVPCSPITPEKSTQTSSTLSTSTPETSSSILTSPNSEFQTVNNTVIEDESDSMGRRLREKKHLFTKENVINMANTWQSRNKIGIKRNDGKETPKSNPKRIKISKAVDNRTSTPATIPKTCENLGTAKSAWKTPVSLSNPKAWTEHEMECLVVGVNRNGSKWKLIHDTFNFHPTRSLGSLKKKFNSMEKNGDYEKYLTNFKKKAGYKDSV